jgi:AraC-like DNA-binding protein
VGKGRNASSLGLPSVALDTHAHDGTFAQGVIRRLRKALRRRDRDDILAAGALLSAMVAHDASGSVQRRTAVLLEALVLAAELPVGALPSVETAIEGLVTRSPDAGRSLTEAWRAVAGVGVSRSRTRRSLASAVEDYLATRLGPTTTLRELATDLGYCPAHVSGMIRRLTGKRFTELRRAMQLERARTLLAGGASVKEAALAAGFGDPAYLSRVFRRHHSVPPSRWRAGSVGTG